jgi:hypothetical protein
MTMRLYLTLLAAALSSAAAAQPSGAPPPAGAEEHRWGSGRLPHGSLFLSPMGEPFRSDDPAHDVVGDWFAQADTNHDGALSLAEIEADATRFFRTLDTNHDGEIDPDELSRYETEIAPEVQVGRQMGVGMGGFRRGGEGGGGRGGHGGGGGRGGWGGRGGGPSTGQDRGSRIPEGAGGAYARVNNGGFDPGLEGAGRFTFLNIPEPVISADTDLNRGVSLREFVYAAGQRFVMLDANHDGKLTRDDLPPLPQRHQGKFKPDKKAPKTKPLRTPLTL